MLSKVILGLAALALAAEAGRTTAWHQLDAYTHADWMNEFGKTYATKAEQVVRQRIFEARLAKIKAHNADPTKTWKEGVNHMSDWTITEFEQLLGYDQAVGYLRREREPKLFGMQRLMAKDSVDWRTEGIVTAVKDQGQCGSCWSFAAAETIESHHAKKTGQLAVLSEQNILSCVPNPEKCGGTGGCEGGTAEISYAYLKEHGIASEWTYPYTSYFGEDDFNCSTMRAQPAAQITGYNKLPSNKYVPLMNAVTTEGPIAISVEASHWQNYESGVFDGCNQTNPDIDHAVQLVGYGTDATLGDYWLVRNSWSPTWGDKGYIKLKRTASEESRCGTDLTPGDGSGCSGGPSTVTVCGTCGILYDTCYPTV